MDERKKKLEKLVAKRRVTDESNEGDNNELISIFLNISSKKNKPKSTSNAAAPAKASKSKGSPTAKPKQPSPSAEKSKGVRLTRQDQYEEDGFIVEEEEGNYYKWANKFMASLNQFNFIILEEESETDSASVSEEINDSKRRSHKKNKRESDSEDFELSDEDLAEIDKSSIIKERRTRGIKFDFTGMDPSDEQ
ncbi:6309_t:CDS:2 [Funneliformis geosporum]|nr:6309_t:CDS:2 [Funneliformis geosporum]